MTFKLLTLNALTTLFILLSNVQSQERLFIPTEFVENIIHSDTASNKHALIKACYETFGIVPEDEEPEQDHYISLKHREADLDADTTPEVLVSFGWYKGRTTLCVLKQINETWNLLFTTPVRTHVDESEVYIANNVGPNKVFYIRMIYSWGSGFMTEGYEFYKLINGKVYECAVIITAEQLHGHFAELNQSMKAYFNFISDSVDAIRVHYTYQLIVGSSYELDTLWGSHASMILVDDKDSVDYVWDTDSSIYRPVYFSQGNNRLNDQKLDALSDPGNGTLFINAFQSEIQQYLQKGTDTERYLFQIYVDFVKKNGDR